MGWAMTPFRIRPVSRLGLSALLLYLACPGSPGELSAREWTLLSPDKTNELQFKLVDGVPSYSVRRSSSPILRASRLGVRLADGTDLASAFRVESTRESAHDETWQQPWGEYREVHCAYNELRVNLVKRGPTAARMTIVFRVFNDGIGFRYEWPQQDALPQLVVSDELTEFAFAENSPAWWIPAFESGRYEYLYQQSPVSALQKVHTPLTVERADGICLCLHEAALTDYASMALEVQEGTTLEADLFPWSNGHKVIAELPHQSPWRTIQIADSAKDLITSNLILNLNEPCQLEDVSWIKPGKYVGVWWEMHLGRSTWESGPDHGARDDNVIRFIDFAAKYGFDGVLVEGWNRGWDGDWMENGKKFNFTQAYPDFDIEKLSAYARERGIYLIGHHETAGAIDNYTRQLESAMSFYQRLGIPAVKTGYVNFGQGIERVDEHGKIQHEWHHGQYMVQHYRHVLETAARYKLMLDVHEPIKATGIRRTFPNMMTREGARGQEYNAWSGDWCNPPSHTTILPFTRLLAGPMDFTPGIFELVFPEDQPDSRVNTTLAKQLALYVVIYSPLQMAADLPEHYERHLDAFQFIRDVPTNWETTEVLHGKIGDYVTIARKARDGNDWFLGSITDEMARSLDAPLSFLEEDTRYVAEIYRDGDTAAWETNPATYVVEQREVDSTTVMKLRLAAGGGQAIRFRPQSD